MIDSHVHFWDPLAREHAWLAGDPVLDRRIVPADYEAHVDGLVVVQADCRDDEGLAEVRWFNQLAADDSRIRGIVAFAPLANGKTARDHVATLARERLVVGVRYLLQDRALTELTAPRLADGVRLLAEFDLPFDVCVTHRQLAAVEKLVGACPDVRFVLDHLGKPGVAAGLLDPWRSDLARLAIHPNVCCKISGLATEAGPDWRPGRIRAFIEHALWVFGPDRCMVGSDWPVLTTRTTAEEWLELVVSALDSCSAAERDAVLAGTASSFYGLERPLPSVNGEPRAGSRVRR